MQKPEARAGIAWCSPPPGMERVLDVAAEDRLHRPDRAAGDRGRGLVHPEERRVVAARTDPRLRLGPAGCGAHIREPLHDVDVARGCGTSAARRRTPAPARDPAPRRAPAAGRSPARTGAASGDAPARSRSRASAGRRRAAAGRARMARYRRWNASTPRRSSTSSGSGRACASRSSATSTTDPEADAFRAMLARPDERRHRRAAEARHRRRPPPGRLDRRAGGAGDAPPAHPSGRRDLGRLPQGKCVDAPRRRGDGRRAGARPHRQQGRRLLGGADRPPARDPGRPSTEGPEARTIRAWAMSSSSSSSS